MVERKKLNSFQIIKINSKILKRNRYKITINYNEALQRNYIVKLAENTFLEVVQRVAGKSVDFSRADEIFDEVKFLGKKKNSNKNRDKIKELLKESLDLIFISKVIMVEFDDVRHYQNIVKDGLYVNGKEFVRVMASAANIRRNSVFFIDKDLYGDVIGILDNGRNMGVRLNPAKYNAYLGLYASSGLTVPTPNFAVVPDYTHKRMATVDWVDEHNQIAEKTEEVRINAFDGQGLIAPRLSKKWSEHLGLDYTPSAYIFRAPFMKGQIVTFDFHEYSARVGKDSFTDIWGNTMMVSDVDVIFSESQAKLWDSYESMDEYLLHMEARKLPFRVSRYTHRTPRRDTTTNYMFVQVLNMDDHDIEELTDYTVEHIRSIRSSSPQKSSLYMSGSKAFPYDFSREDFDRLDVVSRAILIFPDLMYERYITSRISNVIEKKKREAKLGKLLLKGNYSPMVSDPVAQIQAVLKLPVTGLLAEDEHYSDFWLDEEVDIVSAGRSPLTHNSEMQRFKITSNYEMDFWYQYLDTCFIFPFHSLDTFYLADSDWDGDLLWSTDHPVFLKCQVSGLPINYQHGNAEKVLLNDEKIVQADIAGMGSKIGFITNMSSTLHCMRYDFSEGSPELDEIERRLKLFRVFQGEEIDSAKNMGQKKIIPAHWGQFDKNVSDVEKRITADRRPYFTRYLYKHYEKRFQNENDSINKFCWSHFGMSFDDVLMEEDKTDDMMGALRRHFKYSFFLLSESPMNKVCWRMERKFDDIDMEIKSKEFDYSKLYSSPNVKIDRKKLKKLERLMEKHLALKKAWRKTTTDFKTDIWHIIVQTADEAKTEITSNFVELGDLAVALLIENSRSDSFVWTVFGSEIVENLLSRHGRQVDILVEDDYGDEEYLFQRYSKRRVVL
jgi:hypothetical protein